MTSNTIDRIRLFFRKDKEPYLKLHDILGFYPHDITIYQEAFMHRSSKKTRQGHCNNERLEFLGDAVLSAAVADILYKKYKKKQEGYLTTLRSKLVRRETLNELAVKIGLDKLVVHSDHMQGGHNSYMNGNAFEAFLGAVYLDRGYDHCLKFLQEQIFDHYIDIEKTAIREENYKSKLIEWCQKYQCNINFVVTEQKMESGNAPKFFSEIRIEGIPCGKGTGYTKKESHQHAAEVAYNRVKSNVGFVNKLIAARNDRLKVSKGTIAAQANNDTKRPVEEVKRNVRKKKKETE